MCENSLWFTSDFLLWSISLLGVGFLVVTHFDFWQHVFLPKQYLQCKKYDINAILWAFYFSSWGRYHVTNISSSWARVPGILPLYKISTTMQIMFAGAHTFSTFVYITSPWMSDGKVKVHFVSVTAEQYLSSEENIITSMISCTMYPSCQHFSSILISASRKQCLWCSFIIPKQLWWKMRESLMRLSTQWSSCWIDTQHATHFAKQHCVMEQLLIESCLKTVT